MLLDHHSSMALEVTLETGRNLAMSAVSKPGFFRSGDTIACCCESGGRPCVSEAFAILVMNGGRVSTSSRTMKVGTRSSEHDFTGGDDMMTAHVVLQARSERRERRVGGSADARWGSSSCGRPHVLEIFSAK